MQDAVDQARSLFLRGLAACERGHWLQAEADFAAALALVPGRPSLLLNLGVVRLRLGRADRALPLLEQVVTLEPGDAQAWGHLATARAECGHTQAALHAATQAVTLQPALPTVWTLRGTLERELGLLPAARASFEQALAHGADVHLVGYYLAAVAQDATPPAPPRAYVEQLFDQYGDDFEQHLVQTLGYRMPAVMVDGLGQPRYAAALDLGCGSGLVGALLRPRCGRLDGIDLSARMVEIARGRGLYDAVFHADLVEHLSATAQAYDLLTAADVFIYVGDLAPVFTQAARVLRPGGEFCFSVEEAGDAAGFALQPSLRYAHGEGYIRSLAAPHGFEVRATSRHAVRMDQGRPIPGLCVWLTRTGSTA